MQSKNLSLFLNSNIFQEPFFFYFGRMDGLQSEGVVLIPLTILRASQYQSSNKKHSNQTMWARYHHAATCAPRRAAAGAAVAGTNEAHTVFVVAISP